MVERYRDALFKGNHCRAEFEMIRPHEAAHKKGPAKWRGEKVVLCKKRWEDNPVGPWPVGPWILLRGRILR